MHSCGIKSRCIQALLLKSYKWMVRRIPDQRCSKSTCGAKNGITDACSTVDCYPLLTICPRCCPTHLPDDAIIHCRFPQDFSKISPRFIQDFPKIPQDSPRFPPRFLQDFPHLSVSYLTICHRCCPRHVPDDVIIHSGFPNVSYSGSPTHCVVGRET